MLHVCFAPGIQQVESKHYSRAETKNQMFHNPKDRIANMAWALLSQASRDASSSLSPAGSEPIPVLYSYFNATNHVRTHKQLRLSMNKIPLLVFLINEGSQHMPVAPQETSMLSHHYGNIFSCSTEI